MTSLLISRRSDCQFSSEQEAKPFYGQGLRVDTNFVEFRQLQDVGIFSYLVYSFAKSHFMDEDLLGPG